MRHRLLGTGEGVMLDICAQHGTWFDRTELQKAVWFACSGDIPHDRDLGAKALQSRLEKLRGERERERRDAGDDAANAAVWWGEELLSWLLEVRRRRATQRRRREGEPDDGTG